MSGHWLESVLGIVIFNAHLVSFIGMAQSTESQSACVGPKYCSTSMYSLVCAVNEQIAMVGVNYGAKPYSPSCLTSYETCVQSRYCCRYESGDCLVPYSEEDLAEIYRMCSNQPQCGWFFAKSVELPPDCMIRDKTNYVRAEYKCVHETMFIDICSQHSVTGHSIQLQHSAISSSSYEMEQCSCVITPDVCNTTAKIQFKAVDVRLHDINNNLTTCSHESRIEIVGQKGIKTYYCESGKFLHGFEEFHESWENNLILYLHKKRMVYPQEAWIQVSASLSDVKVRVTCGERSVQTAKRCPPKSKPRDDIIDDVGTLPDRPGVSPTVIHLDPDIVKAYKNETGPQLPEEKQSPATAAVIGGIVAGIVVLALLLVLVCFIKRRKKNEKQGSPHIKQCLRTDDEAQVNYYEPINDADSNKPPDAKNIYHQPWGNQPGISLSNRAKPDDLAYATSEEIKVLIEKMEKDRQSIIEGSGEFYAEPDPTYYRHMSTFFFKPDDVRSHLNVEEDEVDHPTRTHDSDTNSENYETDRVESEDSKVEADRGIDFDQSPRVEADVAGYCDGYESPRISQSSEATESLRNSYKSDNLQNYVYKPNDVILEDNNSDSDVPDEHAPPVSEAIKRMSSRESAEDSTDKDKITLGAYREPSGSLDNLTRDNTDNKSDHPYSPVYDEIKDQNTKL